MRQFLIALAVLISAAPAASQPGQGARQPVTIEHYYRIKWGSFDEFMRLYKANHEPILKEVQRQGFISAMKMESPFTHMAGGPRWDLRVTITYRDAPSAVEVGGAYDEAAAAVTKRLYPDEARLKAEEARRFSLLEDHWDVIVTAAE